MNRLREASRDLSYLIELVVKAMFGIVIIYLIAKALIQTVVGEVAANIISAIIGLAVLFAVVVSKRIRDEILAFGKGGQK